MNINDLKKKALEAELSDESFDDMSIEQEMLQEEGYLDLPEPISWDDIVNLNLPEQKWRIKNLIPHEGFVVLAAASGEKKSWLALEMARSIANGIPFLGNPDFQTIEGNVLYIDKENSRSEIKRRGMQVGLSGAKSKLMWIYGDNINLNTDKGIKRLFSIIKKHNISTVVIDTLRAVAGGMEENKAEIVRIFFNRFHALKNAGVSIIFLDHTRKPNMMEKGMVKKEQLFASQDKVASVEILLMLKSQRGTNEIHVHQEKNRLGEEIPAFSVIMEDTLEDGNKKTTFKYGGEVIETALKKDQAKELILSMLSEDQGMKAADIIQVLYDKEKIGQKNVRTALQELEKDKKIDSSRIGKEKFYMLPILPDEEMAINQEKEVTLVEEVDIFDSS
jgi:hypothetical protein